MSELHSQSENNEGVWMPHREHEGGDGDGGGWGLIGAPAEPQDDDAVCIIAQEKKATRVTHPQGRRYNCSQPALDTLAKPFALKGSRISS